MGMHTHITFCLSIHSPVESWVASPFVFCEQYSCYCVVQVSASTCVGHISPRRILGFYDNSGFSFSNLFSCLQITSIILTFLPAWTGISISLCPSQQLLQQPLELDIRWYCIEDLISILLVARDIENILYFVCDRHLCISQKLYVCSFSVIFGLKLQRICVCKCVYSVYALSSICDWIK